MQGVDFRCYPHACVVLFVASKKEALSAGVISEIRFLIEFLSQLGISYLFGKVLLKKTVPSAISPRALLPSIVNIVITNNFNFFTLE